MEPENHLFEKENHLPNLHDFGFHVNFWGTIRHFGCFFSITWTHQFRGPIGTSVYTKQFHGGVWGDNTMIARRTCARWRECLGRQKLQPIQSYPRPEICTKCFLKYMCHERGAWSQRCLVKKWNVLKSPGCLGWVILNEHDLTSYPP